MLKARANISHIKIELHGEKDIPAKRFWVDNGSGDVQIRLEDNSTVYLSDVDDARLGDNHKTITIPYELFKKHWREIVEFYTAKSLMDTQGDKKPEPNSDSGFRGGG